jgi:hypothetical protein
MGKSVVPGFSMPALIDSKETPVATFHARWNQSPSAERRALCAER